MIPIPTLREKNLSKVNSSTTISMKSKNCQPNLYTIDKLSYTSVIVEDMQQLSNPKEQYINDLNILKGLKMIINRI